MATNMIGARGGALFVGIGASLLLARNAPASPAREAIALGMALACAALASLGLSAWLRGEAGAGIFLAVAIEVVLAMALVTVRNR